MNKSLQEYTDEIVNEGLTEAADSFFGRRVQIEHDKELVMEKATQLKNMGSEVLLRGAEFHHLILRNNTPLVRDFYQALNISQPETLMGHDTEGFYEQFPQVRALTKRGLFKKYFLYAYKRLAEAVEHYMRGVYYEDEEHKGRKILSLHYEMLEKMVDTLNTQINEYNTYSKTSDILQFSKKLDVETVEKEKITDSGIEYSWDKDMEFSPIPFESLGLVSFPLLPKDPRALSKVKLFATNLYTGHTSECLTLLMEIKKK